MSKIVDAVYERGVFKPLEEINLPEGTKVKVSIEVERFPEIIKEISIEVERDVDRLLSEVRDHWE